MYQRLRPPKFDVQFFYFLDQEIKWTMFMILGIYLKFVTLYWDKHFEVYKFIHEKWKKKNFFLFFLKNDSTYIKQYGRFNL